MKHHYDLNVFYREDALSYYLLGVFCSDGNIKIDKGNKGVSSITSKDTDWLQLISSLVCETTNARRDKRSDCSKIEFYSIELAHWFITHGCMPKKSLTLKFPDVPTKYLPDFIRGCWDGDGTLGLYKIYRKDRNCWETVRSCKLYTGSEYFANEMVEHLKSINIHATIIPRIMGDRKIGSRTITSTKTNYMVCIQDKQSLYNFCKTIYYNNNPLTMPRKLSLSMILQEECSSVLNKLTPDQIAQICLLVKSGLSYKETGAKFGLSKSKIYRIIKNNSLV